MQMRSGRVFLVIISRKPEKSETSYFSDLSRKEPKDKVTSLLGSQSSEPVKNAVYRVSCWDATGQARAGCIYQAPTRFAHGQVSHFWLASDRHFVRWIHFYDANVVPTSSNPYNSDYAITHSDPSFVVSLLLFSGFQSILKYFIGCRLC